MKYLLFSFLAFSLFLTTACENDSIEGSGNIIMDDRTEGDFSVIEVSDALQVTVRQGVEHSVVLSGDDNLLARVITSTTNGTLSARLGNGNFRNANISLAVTMPNLERLVLNDAVKGELIDFSTTEPLVFIIKDASELTVSGAAASLNLEVEDASKINGFDFVVEHCDAQVRDASSVFLTVNDLIEGRLRSASSFFFRGNPTIDVNATGSSSVIDAN